MKNTLIKVISILMVLAVILTFGACKDENNYEQTGDVSTTEKEESTTVNNELPKNVNPLTGRADLSESAIGARPIAIMVENSPAARPQ
jgi:ABC-type oligopeptide transport system substrate-binding subunit